MCDTFIALPPATGDGSIIFAKNSDRPMGEGQHSCVFPAAKHGPGDALACTYIEIPQARKTHLIALSRIDWMWGGEMGANEHGVVIGNEAVWTNLPPGPPALLGMDLLRLGLERGGTAREALNVMTALLREFGQGGACAENDPGFTYDNSFIIADPVEAWVLETAGKYWVAERVIKGLRNISNRLSIRRNYDLCSNDLADYAQSRGGPVGAGGTDRPDFAALFSTADLDPEPGSRELCGAQLLAQNHGQVTHETMQDLLRDHDSGICMHGMFETTASMVSCLSKDGGHVHWFTDGPNPCEASFERIDLVADTPNPFFVDQLARAR